MFVKTPEQKTFNGISQGSSSNKRRQVPLGNGFKSDSVASNYGSRLKNTQNKRKLPVFTPWKVVLVSFLIGICGVLYIGHVFDTQQALAEVNRLENQFNRVHRVYNQQRLTYDRLTGPKEIYQQARLNGFVNAGPADQVIIIQNEGK